MFGSGKATNPRAFWLKVDVLFFDIGDTMSVLVALVAWEETPVPPQVAAMICNSGTDTSGEELGVRRVAN